MTYDGAGNILTDNRSGTTTTYTTTTVIAC
jgi:hypothetical protein